MIKYYDDYDFEVEVEVLNHKSKPKASNSKAKDLLYDTPPITFRVSECAYMVQIDALSTPECPEGVSTHSRWTARGRTWGSQPSSRRTFKKNVLRV